MWNVNKVSTCNLITHISVFKCPESFWTYIAGQDLSDSKSNRLHVDIYRFCFIHMRYILLKWWVILLKSLISTGYFSNFTGSFVTNRRFSPSPGVVLHNFQNIFRFLSPAGMLGLNAMGFIGLGRGPRIMQGLWPLIISQIKIKIKICIGSLDFCRAYELTFYNAALSMPSPLSLCLCTVPNSLFFQRGARSFAVSHMDIDPKSKEEVPIGNSLSITVTYITLLNLSLMFFIQKSKVESERLMQLTKTSKACTSIHINRHGFRSTSWSKHPHGAQLAWQHCIFVWLKLKKSALNTMLVNSTKFSQL